MKKKYVLFEFTIVLLLLVLPPIFNTTPVQTIKMAFNPSTIIGLFIALALEFQYQYMKKNHFIETKEVKSFYKKTTITLEGLLLLSTVSFVFNLLIHYFPEIFPTGNLKLEVTKEALPIILYIAQIIAAAFYEEEIYRQFLPMALNIFSSPLENRISNNKAKIILCVTKEAIPVLLFALPHIYQGFIGVLNAAVCGTILQLLCKKRSGSIIPGFTAHSIYNIFLFIINIVNA